MLYMCGKEKGPASRRRGAVLPLQTSTRLSGKSQKEPGSQEYLRELKMLSSFHTLKVITKTLSRISAKIMGWTLLLLQNKTYPR